jgi:integrase
LYGRVDALGLPRILDVTDQSVRNEDADMRTVDALGQWFEARKGRWSFKVQEHVKHLLDGWAQAFGEVQIGSLSAAHVEPHELARDNGKRSASALNQERTYLRMFLSWARNHGWVTTDPTANWAYRKYEVKRAYATISREEEERFVKAAPPWLARFVTVAVCTGLREGTLRQLTWDMVIGGGREHGGEGSPCWVLEIPGRIIKQKRPLRLPIAERARAALGVRGAGLIFPELPSEAALYKAFKKWGAAAGINPVTSIHDLRRTWVERLTAANVPVQKIMRLGGWKTMGVILTHYYDKVPDQEALAAVETV